MKIRYFILLIVVVAGCTVPTNETQSPLPRISATVVTPKTSESARVSGTAQVSETAQASGQAQVKLTTSDGVKLEAVYYPPLSSTSGAKALLLLHEAYQDHRSWDSFGKAAQEMGYAVLSLDLRGHGKSGGEKTFDQAMDQDVDAAIAWLRSAPEIDRDRLGIAGASLGANLALRAGGRYPDIQSIALLSPGMLLWDVGIAEAVIEYGARPLLLVTSEEDAYPAGTVQELDKLAKGMHEVQIYPGAEHGTQLLGAHPDLTPLLLDWFGKTIP